MRAHFTRWLAPLLLLVSLAARGGAVDGPSRVANDRDFSEEFSCRGRSAGFYADISTGCQLYHMCDEAGRVFTHSCPERTLFQQRTMVCDHWYMVECNGGHPALRTSAKPAGPPRGGAVLGTTPSSSFALPGRKRHSQRVIANFPYQQGNDTTFGSTTALPPAPKRESFRISSISGGSPRIPLSNSATIERVTRPTFVSGPLAELSSENRQPQTPALPRPAPVTFGRATVERVFKDPFLTSQDDEGASQVQYLSSFREGKSGPSIISTTPSSSSQVVPTFVENTYKENPFFESYFKSSFSISTSTLPKTSTTTQQPSRHEEEESVENKLEIVIPDPRKMFYIPDSNYDSGDASKEEGTVLVIELPVRNTMKFRKVGIKEARNHDCPQCHPSFLLPGLCRPCVLIRR